MKIFKIVLFCMFCLFLGTSVRTAFANMPGCKCDEWIQSGPPEWCGSPECDPPGFETPLVCVSYSSECFKVGQCDPGEYFAPDGTCRTIGDSGGGDCPCGTNAQGNCKDCGTDPVITCDAPMVVTAAAGQTSSCTKTCGNPRLQTGDCEEGKAELGTLKTKMCQLAACCPPKETCPATVVCDTPAKYVSAGTADANFKCESTMCPAGPPCCTAVVPGVPLLGNPGNGTEVKVGANVNLVKSMPDGWGTTCLVTDRTMNVCIGTTAGTCGRLNASGLPNAALYTWTAALPVGNAYWRIQADNGDRTSAWPTAKNFCVEGFSPTNTSYLSAWGACNGYIQTRTCRDDCNAIDDCAPYPLTRPCCTDSGSIAPSLQTPAEGTEVRKGSLVSLNWADLTVANWGTYCPGNLNSYRVCATKNPGVDCLVASANTAAVSAYSFTPAASVVGNVAWAVRSSNNGVDEAWSARKNICIEGFDAANTTYVSAWSTCNSSHTRTRTCREDCGTNDCGVSGSEVVDVVEDCNATITGTLFDASDLSSCPADIGTNPAYASIRYGNQSFGINGSWPVISAPVTTNGSGNFSETVYASTTNPTYTFDFSDVISAGLASGVKLQCQSATATVTTAGQTVVKDTGFWRIYGGWWQAAGGSIHAENGIKSIIPASVAPANQALILPSTLALGNRVGVLSYGTSLADRFGTNPNAAVSSSLWEKESKYDGQIYDWGFYSTRFNSYDKTAWDGSSGSIAYDGSKPYQIFSYAGNVTLDVPDPSGNQKIIYLIDGNVNVTSDIVVPDGAFLSVIASGTITFDPAVGQADGWYVGNSILVPCEDVDGTPGCDNTDTQFLGNGSFVSWGNISMTRVLGLNANNLNPSEKFTYRKDLFINAPDAMKIYSKVFKPFVP